MNIYEGKLNTDRKYPVALVDSVDLATPEPSKVYGDVTVVYSHEDATGETAYTVESADWQEIGHGNYRLRIGASEFTSAGTYLVTVSCSGCHTVTFVVDVQPRTIAEMQAEIHLAKAAAVNKQAVDLDAGETTIYDDDGVTELATLQLDSADAGKTVIREPA